MARAAPALHLETDKAQGGDHRCFRARYPSVSTSYAQRYELLLRKLVLEKHYDGAALVLSKRKEKTSGKFTEPAADLTIKRVLAGLGGHVQEFLAAG